MRELNAVFGGEVTGHYYFRDNFYCDNGVHSGAADPRADVEEAAVAEAAARAAAREIFHLRRDQHEDAEHGCDDGDEWPPSKRGIQDAKISKLDGISIEYPDWHFNVRPSNTEPLLRLNLEGTTADADGAQARRGAVDHSGLSAVGVLGYECHDVARLLRDSQFGSLMDRRG